MSEANITVALVTTIDSNSSEHLGEQTFFNFSKRQRSVAYQMRYFGAIEPSKILDNC